jgi:hypothetical protein
MYYFFLYKNDINSLGAKHQYINYPIFFSALENKI